MNGHDLVKAIENHNLDLETNVASVRVENDAIMVELDDAFIDHLAEPASGVESVTGTEPVEPKHVGRKKK